MVRVYTLYNLNSFKVLEDCFLAYSVLFDVVSALENKAFCCCEVEGSRNFSWDMMLHIVIPTFFNIIIVYPFQSFRFKLPRSSYLN